MNETTPQAHPVEEWTYLGRRVSASDKRCWKWRTPDGTDLIYSHRQLSAAVIGGIYQIEVERNDGKTTVYGSPKFIRHPYTSHNPADADVMQRAEWEAADHAAEAELARLAAERNAAKQSALDDALAPLVKIAKTMRTGYQRDAFAAEVLRRISQGW